MCSSLGYKSAQVPGRCSGELGALRVWAGSASPGEFCPGPRSNPLQQLRWTRNLHIKQALLGNPWPRAFAEGHSGLCLCSCGRTHLVHSSLSSLPRAASHREIGPGSPNFHMHMQGAWPSGEPRDDKVLRMCALTQGSCLCLL